jgi:pimeloyl-ACP methyl ester carboxylesterase
VVLLHGQPGSASDWDPVVRALPSNLRPMAWDRPGYGANPHPPTGFAGNTRWLLAEFDRAGIDETILVGHSYGGGVALAAAALAPDRVRGLVLIASVGPGCLNGWDAVLAAPVIGPVCAVAAWWLTPWFARKRLARIERIRTRPLAYDEYVSWEIWGSAHHDHGAMWRTFLIEQRALVGGLDELDACLDRINTRSVVLADPDDKMIPVATARALHARLAHSRLVLTEGGHHLPRRNPTVIAEQINRLAGSVS